MPQHIQYSDRYLDDTYEYRHVILPANIAKITPKGRLLTEAEWRGLGVQQSKGWIHYAIHRPEPHILLFRRPINAENVPIKLEVKPDVVEELKHMKPDEVEEVKHVKPVKNDVVEEVKPDVVEEVKQVKPDVVDVKQVKPDEVEDATLETN